MWYSLFQARHLIEGPTLTLIKIPETTQTEQVITIEGTTKNITSLTLNGKNIHTNEKGDFKEALVLENGYTIMTLTSQDRFGRTTSLSRSFVYTPLNNNKI